MGTGRRGLNQPDLNPRQGATTVQYLEVGPEPVFSVFHEASGADLAVPLVICPPFGWEDIASYRPRRSVAIHLAGQGVPVLRFDLPGAGDSAGDAYGDDRLERWVGAVHGAAEWLRARQGTDRVAVLGTGVSGLAAALAFREGGTIDDLILWGVKRSGRALVRELRAFGRMELGADVPDGDGGGDDGIAVAGYRMTAQTCAALSAVDLGVKSPPVHGGARVLLLGRGDRAPDDGLVEAFEGTGAAVTKAHGAGFEGMFVGEPQSTAPAWGTVATVLEWLRSPGPFDAPGPEREKGTPPRSTPALGLDQKDGHVRESPFQAPHRLGDGFGIVTERVDRPTALNLVLLNAGPQRHIGPNRMWVEAARRLSSRGVRTLRLDVAGIGDGGGADWDLTDFARLYEPEYLDQLHVSIDRFMEGHEQTPLAVGGLCVGGWWAIKLMEDDPRVRSALLINPSALIWDGGTWHSQGALVEIFRQARKVDTWKRVVRGEVRPQVHLRTAKRLLTRLPDSLRRHLMTSSQEDAGGGDLRSLLDGFAADGSRFMLAFAGEEPLIGRLQELGQMDLVRDRQEVSLQLIPVAANVHTVRPPAVQRAVHRVVDAYVGDEIARLSHE